MTETPSTNRLPESLMDSIEELIVTGEYPPGMRLEEIELAATFGVSQGGADPACGDRDDREAPAQGLGRHRGLTQSLVRDV